MKLQAFMVCAFCALSVVGCASSSERPTRSTGASSNGHSGGGLVGEVVLHTSSDHQKVGRPYQVSGRTYVPQRNDRYDETGIASWYGPNFHGRPTANGELFDQNLMTAAHPTLPIPSIVEVTNLENGRTLRVRLNDRGPFVDDRMIDLSRAAADALGYRAAGLARVRVRYIGPAQPAGHQSLPPARVAPVAPTPVAPTPAVQTYTAPSQEPVSGEEWAAWNQPAIETPLPVPTPPSPTPPSSALGASASVASAGTGAAQLGTGLADEALLSAQPLDSAASYPPARVDMADSVLSDGASLPARPVDMSDPIAPYEQTMNTVQDRASILTLQAGAFSDPVNAQSLVLRLSPLGETWMETGQSNGRTIHRVFVGRLSDMRDAETLRQHLAGQGFGDARIVPANR